MSIELMNKVLVATPLIEDDPYFSRAVIYINQHNEDGTLGMVLNRPSSLTVRELLEEVDLPTKSLLEPEAPVLLGGPIARYQGYVVHFERGTQYGIAGPGQDIDITYSKKLLKFLSEGGDPADINIFLGVASWEVGQLEKEIQQSHWLLSSANPVDLFKLDSESRYQAAQSSLGIDMFRFYQGEGHV